MMRLPAFTYLAPRSLAEAAELLAAHQPDAVVVAGGTDLLPKLKRRQQQPKVVIGLRRVEGLRGITAADEGGLRIGAMTTLAAVAAHPGVRERYAALAESAVLATTPHLRLMGTLGGNLCVDTRCTYYDQSAHWRESVDFCMKCPGSNAEAICWVAPGSERCWAVSSADTAPVAVALQAQLRLVSAAGERVVEAGAFYRDDGIEYLHRRPDEILAEVRLPPLDGWRATYLKLRRRGSFDFPVLGVAAAVKRTNGHIEDARLVLGAVGSAPVDVSAAADVLIGARPTPEAIEAMATAAWRGARPLDNTDLNYAWRKKMARVYARRALEAVCGN
jgi:4-hydroxybenzoyl-CoA reductase subunit beta